MHEQGLLAAELVAELADRLQKRQALDVADGAADLAEHEIGVVGLGADEFLDGVGHVRNDLHGGAEIVAAPFLGDDGGIDAPGGDAVEPSRRNAGEALVVAEVEIGLGTVVGDVDFAVLIRAHGAGINVEIGIELAQAHLVAARLQQRAQRCRCQSLA